MRESRGDLYKTKLCNLFISGNCSRQSCSFAHGEDDLRKAPDRSYHHRDRSYYRRSPSRGRGHDRRYDRRDRGTSHSWSPTRQPSKSLSSPRSTGQKRSGSNIEREVDVKKPCKGEHLSELSEVRVHGDVQSEVKEVQSDFFTEQLHKAEADLEELDSQKLHLQNALANASQEKQRLYEKLNDLEAKVAVLESDNRKLERLQSGYSRYFRCQDDLKRAEARLRRIYEQNEEYRRHSIDPYYEAEHDNNSNKWRNRHGGTNGHTAAHPPLANGIGVDHDNDRGGSLDPHDMTDNVSEQNFLEAAAF